MLDCLPITQNIFYTPYELLVFLCRFVYPISVLLFHNSLISSQIQTLIVFVHQQKPAPNSYTGNSSSKEKETTKKQKQDPVSTEISQAMFKQWQTGISTSVGRTDDTQQCQVMQSKHNE